MRVDRLTRASAFSIVPVACLAVLSGCDQLLDLGGLHDRAQDGGGTAAAGPDASARDTGAPLDATTETSADSAGATGADDSGSDASHTGDASSTDATLDAMSSDAGAGSDAGPSGVAIAGAACSTPGTLACAGHTQRVTLFCGGSVWTYTSTCPTGQYCDSRPGPNQGTCTAIDPPCASASPGSDVCSTTTTVIQCGPDLVSHSAVATCTNQTCISGACTGSCAPGQTNPIACGNCGTDTQTCSASGAWQTSGTCAGNGACSPTTTQSCNTYGTQTCSSTCAWGPCSCPSAPVCTPNSTECAGRSVTTCDACHQWGGLTACSGTTPYCANGACSATQPIPTSCQTGGATVAGVSQCGASNDSCCTSLAVSGGTFYRTYTNTGSGPTGEADAATVSDFLLDKYQVTVGRFREFVSAWNGGSGYTPPAGSGKHGHLNSGNGLNADGGGYESGWLASDDSNVAPTDANLDCDASYATWTTAPGAHENLPINCVYRSEAYAFCIWDGGFLPSEAEWAYAAAGGSNQREYPWGSAAPGTANQYAIYGCLYPSGSGSCTGPALPIAPVGKATLGAGLWGQLDFQSNVYEYVLDSYAGYRNPSNDGMTPPGALTDGNAIRGGVFNGDASGLLPTTRTSFCCSRFPETGFRCARSP